MSVSFEAVSSFSAEHLERNEKYAQSLGLPSISSFEATGRVAIVGGGPSINQYKYTLQSWNGPVLGINRTWKWCKENKIDAVFFSFDANPSVAGMVEGADKAILGNRVDPEVFKRLDNASIWVGEGNLGGTTSVGAAIIAALRGGADKVVLFGCEGSYQVGSSHAYAHFEPEDELIIWCNNMHFITNPQMFMASVELSTMIKYSPTILKEQSGGLLRAMIETEDGYDIVGCTRGFQAKIDAAAKAASEAA